MSLEWHAHARPADDDDGEDLEEGSAWVGRPGALGPCESGPQRPPAATMPYTNEQLILFYYPNTIGSRKMLLVLYTRGMSFMPRIMDVQHGEQMEPWFLDMSPLGELPVLKHGDSVFTEVDQMMLYIDQICPSPDPIGKLFPDKGTELGNMVENLVRELGKINMPLIVYGALFHPEMTSSSSQSDDDQKRAALVKQGKAQIIELMERNPDYVSSYVEKQRAYDTFLGLAQSEGAVCKELDDLEKTIDAMEDLLNTRKIAGNTTPDAAQTWLFFNLRVSGRYLPHGTSACNLQGRPVGTVL